MSAKAPQPAPEGVTRPCAPKAPPKGGKMKKVGMIFEDSVALNAAFYMHAYSAREYVDGGGIVDTGMRTITYKDTKYQYILIKDEKDTIKISGMEFDAIFSEVVNPQCKQYILSRFRPRFN